MWCICCLGGHPSKNGEGDKSILCKMAVEHRDFELVEIASLNEGETYNTIWVILAVIKSRI